jgi:hypothetical protein
MLYAIIGILVMVILFAVFNKPEDPNRPRPKVYITCQGCHIINEESNIHRVKIGSSNYNICTKCVNSGRRFEQVWPWSM